MVSKVQFKSKKIITYLKLANDLTSETNTKQHQKKCDLCVNEQEFHRIDQLVFKFIFKYMKLKRIFFFYFQLNGAQRR